jgi:hypothetical protein
MVVCARGAMAELFGKSHPTAFMQVDWFRDDFMPLTPSDRGQISRFHKPEKLRSSGGEFRLRRPRRRRDARLYDRLQSGRSAGDKLMTAPVGRPVINLAGQIFGRLTAREFVGTRNHHALWLCLCSCGNEHIAEANRLRLGRTRSCGCLRREFMRGRVTRDGASYCSSGCAPSEYITWLAMRNGCADPKHDAFKYYGGRGIKVCARWTGSFEAFLADIGRRPSLGHSIYRNDPDGDYIPLNCRWATPSEQRAKQGSRK